MRNLISFAVACLVLLPATGVRAAVFPVGDDGGPGASVGGEGGPEKRVVRPTVMIDTVGVGELDAKFRIELAFDQTVTGLVLTEIGVTNAITVSDLVGSGQDYHFDIRTNTDFVGSITITVPEGAAENGGGDGNVAMTFTFAVDNKAPALERATASRDTITLEYDETLDEDHEPHRSRFTVMVWDAEDNNRTAQLRDEPRVRGDRVLVLLEQRDSIRAGDSVEIDYRPPGSDALQDARGNTAPDLDGESVINLRTLDRPGAVQDLTATGVNTDTINIGWDPPADDGGSDILGYRIQASNDGGNTYSVLRSSSTGSEADTASEYVHDGLEPDETWHYLVSAINSTGEGTITGTSATTKREGEVPGAPTELTAEPDGNTAIDLDWDAPADTGSSAITGYRIEVSTDEGTNWTNLVTTTNTFYEHSGLQPDTTLHYRVWARNDTGESDNPSNLANATTTTTTTAPAPPTGLTATAQGQDQIDLSWTEPSNDGGSPITGYRIEMSDDGTTEWTDLEDNTGSADTTYADNTVTAGTTRHYRVSAINAVGTGNPSNVDDATTEGSLPGGPTGLTATARDTSQIDLAWTAPTDDGGAAISGYQIEYRSDAGSIWRVLVANTDNTDNNYTDSGLERGTTRHYRVSAINAVGTGNPSNVATETTRDAPGSPTNLTATANGQTQIDLLWTEPASNGGSPITGYQIDVSANRGATWTMLVENSQSTATTYPHEGLTAGTTRHYQVRAINAIGTGPASNVDHATTVAAVPDAPTNLTATASGRTRIDLDWDKPPSDGGSPIIGYRIQMSEDAGVTWSTLVSDTERTATSYAHTGLSAGTTRHYRVRALNAVGAGAESNVDSATTAPDVPDAPTGLNAVAAGTSRIDLSWSEPANDNGSAVTGYKIEVSNTGNSGWSVHEANTNTTAAKYSHTGLTPDTTLYYRVSAINEEGTGPSSNVDHATIYATVPGAPTGLEAMANVANGSSQIDLSWTAPTYDGGSPVTGYQVEVSEDGESQWEELEANTSSTAAKYSHTGLTPDTTLYYRVSAINEEGTGPSSNVDDATTDATVPGAPTGLEAMAKGSSQIDLSWTAPTYDGGSPVTGYRIEVSITRGLTWSTLEQNTGSTLTSYSHMDLPAATTRHYRVSTRNVVGEGVVSNVDHATTDPEVPDAPTDLTANARGTSRIELSWTAPSYTGGVPITGYQVEVSEDGGSQWEVHEANTSSTSTKYTHTSLDPASTRHYRVSAINVAGPGDPSNVDHATTDATVPGAPTGLGAMAKGSSRIDLSWTAPTYDGGSPVTGYRIEVSTTGGLTWSTLEQNTGSTLASFSHMDLPAATTRHYRVSARNVVGAGVASNVDHATTDPEVPDAPTDLTANARGTSRIELAWTAPSYTGGVPITGYQIEVSEDGGSQWEVHKANTSSTSTKYTHTSLDPASTRHYRVSAINVAGPGDPSNVDHATTDATTPDAPTDLAAVANGTSRIDLVWTVPAYDGGAAVTGYRIEVSVDRGLVWRNLVENTNSTATSFAHTGLSPATTRHYRVSAINRVGPGDPSNVEQATTDATVPNAPARLSATAKDHSQIDLDWAAPDFDGGSAVTGYRIEVSENEGSTWTNLVANTGSTTTAYSHTDLAPATTRHYRVSAINAIGTGNPSNMANATTDAIAPNPPTNLVATATAPTRIDLTWSAPAYDGGAPITSYRIEVSLDGINWTDLQRSTGVSLTSYAHIGLRPGSTRHYRVSAINVAGTGLPSGVASASTDDPVERAGRVNEAVLPHFAAAMTTSTLSAIAGRIESVASRNPLGSQLSAAGLLSQAGNMGLRGSAGGLDMARLFNGASFALPLGGDGQDQEGSRPPGITTWGSAEYTSMGEPTGEEIEWEGDMLSIHVGADMRVHRDFLAGVAGTRSSGNYDFTDVTGEREVEGTYEARMTSLNPYLAWLPGRKGVSLWAAGSFGWGEVAVDDQPGGRRASDASSKTGAVGGSRIMLSSGASALRLRAEGWLSRVEVDGDEGMDSLTLEMQRLRLAVEWSQVHQLPGGQEVNFVLEGGLRYGDGDGTEGTGMEVGGGLRFVSATQALTVEGHGRLLATGPSDYEEWGVRGLIQIDPQAVNRGLSLKIVPAWGQSASGVQELWEQGVSDRPDMSHARQRGRVNTRVEYGLGEFNGTPYGRFYLAGGGARAFGTGMRYELTRVLDLRVEGTRTEGADGPARHGLAMRGRWVF